MAGESPTISKLNVIIVGAGVAGLTTAYGLRKEAVASHFNVRVLEKRSEAQCQEAGYPIHLSPSARTSLQKLLSPSDWDRLSQARKRIPTRHDGLTVMNAEGQRVWYTIREPGEVCMVERGDLLNILREGAGPIQYENQVVSITEHQNGLKVDLSNGTVHRADLLIAADGMFSLIRESLHPHAIQSVGWTTINLRTSRSFSDQHISDPYGLNVRYGKSWSATIVPLRTGAYVALTVPSPVDSIPDALRTLPSSDFVDALLSDPGLESARRYPLFSSWKTTPGSGRIVLLGDAAHGMTPFAGSGASSAIHDAYELVETLLPHQGLTTFNEELVKRNDRLVWLSKTVMDLAQGKTSWTRAKRTLIFRTLDLLESFLPFRSRNEAQLSRLRSAESGGQ